MHNWPKLGIKCLNSINILNENWSSQSLILGQFSASMTEPHFRININIYNDVNINVNVKITIAHQVGIILQPLGSDHSSLNNTIEFRTSHSNQLVFIALFFCQKRTYNGKLKLRNCTDIARVSNVCSRPYCWSSEVNHIFIALSNQVDWNIYIFSKYIDHLFIAISNKSVEIYIFSRNMWTIFLLQFQTRSVDIYFFKICEPFFCNFKPGLMKDIFFFFFKICDVWENNCCKSRLSTLLW